MILCITPNPAIDRTLLLPSLTLGNVHRAQRIIVTAGGKGLNVARTIRNLGGDWPESLGDAVAAGTANALSACAGQFGLETFQLIRKQIDVLSW